MHYFITIIIVGCKHWASEGVFYIGGCGFVCQIIEPVTFARCDCFSGASNTAMSISLHGYIHGATITVKFDELYGCRQAAVRQFRANFVLPCLFSSSSSRSKFCIVLPMYRPQRTSRAS